MASGCPIIKMKFKQFDMVEVYWLDPANNSEWNDVSKFKHNSFKPLLCHSIGFFLKDDKCHVNICATMGFVAKDDDALQLEVNQVGDILAIPKGCIESIKKLPKRK